MTACLSSRHIICVCVHVYGVAAKRLPKIGVGGGGGGGGGGGNLIEEEAKLPAAAVELLPAQSTAPNPNPVSLHHAVSSPLAFTMDQKYLVGVTKPWRELAAMTSQFAFRTPRARASRAVRESQPQPQRMVSLRGQSERHFL